MPRGHGPIIELFVVEYDLDLGNSLLLLGIGDFETLENVDFLLF